MTPFQKLWLVLLIIIIVVCFVIAGTFIEMLIGNMIFDIRTRRIKLNSMRKISNSMVNSTIDGADKSKAAQFIKEHDDEEIEKLWNTFFDGKPPFELDIKELREQAKDYEDDED